MFEIKVSWGDIAWSFHNDGVGGLKSMLLDVGIDVKILMLSVSIFIFETVPLFDCLFTPLLPSLFSVVFSFPYSSPSRLAPLVK